MFERFTREARKAVTTAVEEARARGDARIGTEHLLLGAFDSETLARLGLDPDAIRSQLDRLDAAALEAVGVDPGLIEVESTLSRPGKRKGHIPFTGGAKQVLVQALKEAIELGDRHIGAEHIALALTARPANDRATMALRGLGLEPESLRQSLLEVLRRAS